MAADLHIHVRTPEMTDDIMRMFFASSIGDGKWRIQWAEDASEDDVKKYWEERDRLDQQRHQWEAEHGGLYELFNQSPEIWVGEVSWLKAALLQDPDTFVPSVVERIAVLLADGPIVDDQLIAEVREAFTLPNTTNYSTAPVEDVVAFLEQHKGKEVFTISW